LFEFYDKLYIFIKTVLYNKVQVSVYLLRGHNSYLYIESWR